MFSVTAAAFALSVSWFVAAALSGVVLDPNDLPVPGARVELSCGERVDSVETDAQGRFEFNSASDWCRITVVHRGFAPAVQPVGQGDEVIVRLRVANVTEVLTVMPELGGALRRASASVVSLADAELKTVAGNSADLIRSATLLAGASIRPTVIYVDGLPGSLLPPIEMIERITVNADPFSAEHADGDVMSVQIITKAPSRTLRFSFGGDLLGMGGHEVLATRSHSKSRFKNGSVTGPVPHLPLTFAARINAGRRSADVAIQAIVPNGGAGADTATTTSSLRSAALDVSYSPASPLRARVSYRESRANGSNLGVGGLVLPEAGFASSTTTREARAIVTAGGSALLYEGGLVVGRTSSTMTANSDAVGVAVLGDFIQGGASSRAADTDRVRWTSKHVLRSNSLRQWSMGMTLAGTHLASHETPNALGTFQFADAQAYANGLAGGRTATWFVTRGSGSVRHTDVTLAPFVQKTLVHGQHIEVDGGVRADYQSGFGTIFSPRLFLATGWRGFNLHAGAGLFVRPLPESIFLSAIASHGQHRQQFVTTNASLLLNIDDASLDRLTSIHTQLSSNLTRPRQWMERISVERRLRGVLSAIDYTWTHDTLLGADRYPAEAGWVDVVESNRTAQGRRLHTHISYAWKGHRLASNYEWVHSRDNSDGPFSFPERPGNLAAESARSAGLSPHNVTGAVSFRLPAAISLSVTHTWRTSSPFNITTGLDPVGDGRTLDRGGRARNSGNGPAYQSLSAYGYRRIRLPAILWKSARRPHINLGVQADNILNQRYYSSVGSIAGSARFGQPLAAFPSRSVRFFLNID